MQLSGDKVFSTDGIAPYDRFAYWGDVLGSALGARTISRRDPQTFQGRLALNRIDCLSLVHGLCASLSVSRTVSNISTLGSESLHWICPLQGRVEIHQCRRSTELRAGDSGFVLSGEPFTLNYLDSVNALTLDIPIDRVAMDVRGIRDLSATNLTHKAQSASALATLLRSLPASRLRADASSSRRLADLAIDMALVVLHEFQCQHSRAAESMGGNTERVTRYIEVSLKDPLLSPRHAALALGMSERAVHKAMADTGETFMEHLRARRLDRIAAILRAPGPAAPGLAGLVFEWGFNDLSTFYRAFRNRFDCTPTDWMKRDLAPAVLGVARDRDRSAPPVP